MFKEKSLSNLNKPKTPSQKQSVDFRQSLTKENRLNINTSILQDSLIQNISTLKNNQNVFRKQKSIINIKQTNIQNKNPNGTQNSRINIQYCQNHNNKIANFGTFLQDDTYYYCQKCAISIASQGFSVCKLNQNNLSIILRESRSENMKNNGRQCDESKKIELDFFMDHIDFIKQSLQNRNDLNKKNKKERQRQFEQIRVKIERYFSDLVSFINKEKILFMQRIQKQQQNYLAQNNNEFEQINLAIKTIENIKYQISNIYSIQNHTNYIIKITKFKQQLKKIKNLVHRNPVQSQFTNYHSLTPTTIHQIQKYISNSLRHQHHSNLHPNIIILDQNTIKSSN